MKVKLLKKVRKEYQIDYREIPYDYDLKIITNFDGNGNSNEGIIHDDKKYKLTIPNRSFFLFRDKLDNVFLTRYHKTINDAKEYIIHDLRKVYPNLGNYNRQRKIREQEHKVWYNGI